MEIDYQQLKAYIGRTVKQRCKKRGCKFNATQESVIAAVTYTAKLSYPKSHYVQESWMDVWFRPTDDLTRFDVVETIVKILNRKASRMEEEASRCYRNGQRHREYIALSKACSQMISCLVANRDDLNDYVARLESEREEMNNAKKKEQ